MSVPEPHLPRSLRLLRHEVDLHWPDRDKSSDGWIGDAAHRARSSDHNPDDRGVVHALDITAADVSAWPLVVAITQHPSTQYVIYRGLLFSRTHHFRPVRYQGSDPHTSHLHVSIRPTTFAERSRVNWLEPT